MECSCSYVVFPMSGMRPDSAFSLTFPGRVKLTQIKCSLTEGVNFKAAQLKCVSSGAGRLFKIKMLPSKGAGKAFGEQSAASARKVGVTCSVKKRGQDEFSRASLPTRSWRQPGISARASLGSFGTHAGATRADFGDTALGRAGCCRPGGVGGRWPRSPRPFPGGNTTARRREVAATLLLWSLRGAGPRRRGSGSRRRPQPPASRLRHRPGLARAPRVSAGGLGPSSRFSLGRRGRWRTPSFPSPPAARVASRPSPCPPAGAAARRPGSRSSHPPVLPVRPVPHACSTSLPAACSSAAGHGGSAGCSTAPGSPSRRAAAAGDAAQGVCCRGQFLDDF